MKQAILKRFAAAALVLCAAPATLWAQADKEKEKVKEKSTRQQIIITRTGDKAEKTVIEIEGDKVKVNGKDAADAKDVNVHVLPKDVQVNVNSWSSATAPGFRVNAGRHEPFGTFDNNGRMFVVDSNRAMLGVVTEGDDRGAEIQSITKESGAEKAGLKKGDVITKIDNRKIESTDDVTDAVRAHKPGDKITITYLRDEKEQKTTAELGRWKGIDVKGMVAPRVLSENVWRDQARAAERQAQAMDRLNNDLQKNYNHMYGTYSTTANRPRLGMGVQDTDDGKGVKVINTDDEGTAAKAGIKEDDIITQIDDKAVNSADEVARIVKEKKDQPSLRFQITRNGKPQTIEVKIPRKLKTVDL